MTKKNLAQRDPFLDDVRTVCDLIDDPVTMPGLEQNLRLILFLLVLTELTLVEIRGLLEKSDTPVREYLAGDTLSAFDFAWQDILKLPPKQFEKRMESTLNRIQKYIEHRADENEAEQ